MLEAGSEMERRGGGTMMWEEGNGSGKLDFKVGGGSTESGSWNL